MLTRARYTRRGRGATAGPLCAALLFACGPAAGPAAAAVPTAEAPEPGTEEIVVSGERAGPRLWKVSHEAHVLWVLGTINPLPKDMTWRSGPVEEAIAESQEVLLPGGISVSAGPLTAWRLYRQWRRTMKPADGSRLHDALPAPLQRRFAAAQARYAPHSGGSLDELRPMFAAERLYWAAESSWRLSHKPIVVDQVRRLARQRHVPVREIALKIAGASDAAMQAMADLARVPRERELACLAATLTQLEGDLATNRAAALAWADGDTAALRALPYRDQEYQCWDAIMAAGTLGDINAQLSRLWLDAVVAALASHASSFAVYAMPDLIKPDGLLAQLRQRGYTIEGP